MPGFGQIAERLRRSTAQVFTGSRGAGSGIVWNATGLILTNAHVARTSTARVELWDGRTFDARLVSRDPRRDLATLQISAANLDRAKLDECTPGDSTALRPGELVMAVGSPLGFSGALSTGVVHSIGPLPGMGRQSWIRAGVRLAPGNSGGPLANANGQVVGINTAIVNGLGAAVPSAAALDFLKRGSRPALGVTLRALPFGLMILDLEPDGPAATSSLRTGDVLLCSFDELSDALDSDTEVLRLRFLRGNRQVREVAVRVGRRAEAA
jgi:serine protease Do